MENPYQTPRTEFERNQETVTNVAGHAGPSVLLAVVTFAAIVGGGLLGLSGAVLVLMFTDVRDWLGASGTSLMPIGYICGGIAGALLAVQFSRKRRFRNTDSN